MGMEDGRVGSGLCTRHTGAPWMPLSSGRAGQCPEGQLTPYFSST